jgi:hypothetical protein
MVGSSWATYRMACLQDYIFNLGATLADVNSKIDPTFFGDESRRVHSSRVRSLSELELLKSALELVEYEILKGKAILPEQCPPLLTSKLLEISSIWA